MCDCKYPDDVHQIRVPAGHRVAAQWESTGGRIHEVWFMEPREHQHSIYTRCGDCNAWGTNLPREKKCGNCGSMNTVVYYPEEMFGTMVVAKKVSFLVRLKRLMRGDF